MATFKKSMKIATNFMSRYIYLHFYFGIISAIIVLLRFWHIPPASSIMRFNDGLAILIFGSAILFVPSMLWFILIKIFKNIHPVILIPYCLIFYMFQAITVLLAILFGIVMPVGGCLSQLFHWLQ